MVVGVKLPARRQVDRQLLVKNTASQKPDSQTPTKNNDSHCQLPVEVLRLRRVR
jgi:hypothetical protein